MLSGTIVAGRVLLPRIYKCPDGATCHHNFDPSGNIVPRLQTVITYWLQFGIFISGIGLSKLISYNSRLVLKKDEDTTVLAVERSISAADGDWIDTALQLRVIREHVPRRFIDRSKIPMVHGTSWLGILCFTQIAIGIFISFVVGFSIPDLQSTTTALVPFTYRSIFTLPRADTRFTSLDERIVGGVLHNWSVLPNTPRRIPTAFDGSLVVQDNRTILATNSRAGGPRITGSISCSKQGWNASILSLESDYFDDEPDVIPPGAKAYNISNNEFWVVAYSYVRLAGSAFDAEISDSIITRQYVWAGNTDNVVPNSTASHDGGIFYAACNHTTHMDEPPPPAAEPKVQVINPSQPVIFTVANDPFFEPCPSSDPLACVSWSVDRILMSWWEINFVDHDLIPFSCLNDMLAAYDGLSDTANCALNGDRWLSSLSTTLSALIFSAPLSGNAAQDLSVPTEAINKDWWWIQTILPGATFLLYLACLAYTWHLSMGRSTGGLQELDLAEIMLYQVALSPASENIRDTKLILK
ncbi:hypothetical protein CVT25_008769 [Psilocybe cyanescens]|uniref:Uncharacterized protein n=1 Tax=Psilocybe cyanescens TaxID=93625 RepID=A0A409XN27_PSICY|nr:hypothetical protein CVT25_008769 [Psilocybe cyanescens]